MFKTPRSSIAFNDLNHCGRHIQDVKQSYLQRRKWELLFIDLYNYMQRTTVAAANDWMRVLVLDVDVRKNIYIIKDRFHTRDEILQRPRANFTLSLFMTPFYSELVGPLALLEDTI